MNHYYVYIIESSSDGTLYKGFTTDYKRRLRAHNDGESRYTKGKGPWRMIYLEVCASKREALIRERQLKRYNHKYIYWLREQPSNLLLKLD